MKKLFIGLSLLNTLALFGQIDFNNYRTLTSAGLMPDDFSKQTREKLVLDKGKHSSEFSQKEEKAFLEMIHYGIDNILHSGLCVYGDPVSSYVTKVAKNLIKDDPKLSGELRFYTLKSNVANAFSTDQGIVFITTGLIAQFANEAQLAYVLAHEISHYTENHVVQTFNWNLNNSTSQNYIAAMSTYSKEKEFESDKIAVEMCHKAGYSAEELYYSFDVLMYSYLPFDEIELPKDYFNSTYAYIPEFAFSEKSFPIKADEDYDDKESTHPNIKKRRDSVDVSLKKFSEWGDEVFLLDEQNFYEIRNVARFESVRSHNLYGEFGKALYSIFILEREFPESIYLQRMKAHAWQGLLEAAEAGRLSKALIQQNKYQGEGAALHFFIKNMKKEQLATMALRQVYDCKMRFPTDNELNQIYTRCLASLAQSKSFKLENYATQPFHEAASKFLNQKDTLLADTLNVVEEVTNSRRSKYDRIKSKSDPTSVMNFDSTNYHTYLISDLLADPEFKKLYTEQSSIIADQQKEEERIAALPLRELNKINSRLKENESKLGIEELVVVEPRVFSHTKEGVDQVKSDHFLSTFSESIKYSAEMVGTDLYYLDRRNLLDGGTAAFNERNALMSLAQQIIKDNGTNDGVLPLDYYDLQQIQEHYGTANVLFCTVDHRYYPRMSPSGIVGLVFVPPILPVYLMRGFFAANQTSLAFLIMDLNKGSIVLADDYDLNSPVKKWYLRSQMYNILKEVSQKPE